MEKEDNSIKESPKTSNGIRIAEITKIDEDFIKKNVKLHIWDEDKKPDFIGSVKMQTAKDIFSELDKEVINNPESMIDTESRLKYTEIKQKYIKV